jgi:hypothetical protein
MSISGRLARRLVDYDDPRSFGSRLRARRARALRSLVREVYEQQGSVRIVDVGGLRRYWNIMPDGFLAEHRVEVTLVNPVRQERQEADGFHFVHGDGCDLSMFDDGSFDIAHSNSVIEHVGGWDRVQRFAAEMRRVAPRYFVQTPNFWFPVEPHFMTPFFHWLPRPTRIWLMMRFALGPWPRAASIDAATRTEEEVRLLNRKMLSCLFPDAEIVTEWFLLMPKSLVAIKRGRVG